MKYVLAPLADFTNAAFRKLCHRWGADLTCTEMVSAAALAHGAAATRQLLETLPGEGPVACQIFGANPDELAFAAREIDNLKRFVAIDLNAGCPMPRIVHGGAGAALINDPQLVYGCLAAIRRETDLPVTLKTRPGPSPDRVKLFELLAAAESAGCAGMTLHGRFTSQMHGGAVNYDLIAALVQRASFPVTGNGGVYDKASAQLMRQTGVSAIMIGRAALANPWLFGDLKSEEDVPYGELRVSRQNDVFKEHVANLIDLHGQIARNLPDVRIQELGDYLATALRTHLFRYFNGRPGAAELRRKMGSLKTFAAMQAAIAPLLEAGSRNGEVLV